MFFFVEVILPLSLAKTFTYSVSEAEYHYIKKGMRVAVPFGKSKIYTALVIELHQNKPTLYEAKDIHQILDEKPIVTAIQIAHWQWIASYYMCTIGDVYRGAMPSALLLESETVISQKQDLFVDESLLSDDEYLVYKALQQQSSLKVQDIMSILNKKNIFPVIQKLIDKNILVLQEEMLESYKPKLVRYVRLHPKYESNAGLGELLETLKSANKQKEIVLSYFQLSATEKTRGEAERSGAKELYKQVLETSKKWKNSENLMYVVGATKAEYFTEIRKIVPDSFLLVPGVGAQGGSLSEVCKYGMNANVGLLINSSRAIIYASKGTDFAEKAREEALKMQQEMEGILKIY